VRVAAGCLSLVVSAACSIGLRHFPITVIFVRGMLAPALVQFDAKVASCTASITITCFFIDPAIVSTCLLVNQSAERPRKTSPAANISLPSGSTAAFLYKPASCERKTPIDPNQAGKIGLE